MNCKDYLQKIRIYEQQIKVMEERLDYLRNKATGLKALTYDRVNVQTSTTASQMEEDLTALVMLEGEYKRLIIQAESERIKAIQLINSLGDPVQIEIMYRRYIKSESWNKIIKEMKLKERSAFIEHSKALKEIQGRLEDTRKNKTLAVNYS